MTDNNGNFPTPPPLPPQYGPPPGAPRPSTGTAPLVWGIVLLFLSLFSFPRGVSAVLLSIARPDDYNLAEALGTFIFGAALVFFGIFLIVRATRIKRRNREAAAAYYAQAQQYGQAPYPGQQPYGAPQQQPGQAPQQPGQAQAPQYPYGQQQQPPVDPGEPKQ